MVEIWRTIVEFPDYEVSSLGRVRRARAGKGATAGRIKKQVYNRRLGYVYVALSRNDQPKNLRVNRVVCEAFHGPAPTPAHQAAHQNGDRTDNRAVNLRWATRTENEVDKLKHGTRHRGERSAVSKLTDGQVIAIRADHRPQSQICRDYGVSQSLISMIKRRHIWGHV